MTRAKALRDYFKNVCGEADIEGMSEVAVWKSYLALAHHIESQANSMVGIYQELADNNITITADNSN